MRSPSSPLVVCDIGNTLVHGPDVGPATRLTESLGLAPDPDLSAVLMTSKLTCASDLADLLNHRYPVDPAEADATAYEIWTSQETDAYPFEGALDALSALHQAGVRLALLSNIWAPFAASVWRWFGPLFDAAIPPELQVLSYREASAKPEPELFMTVLRRSRTPADCAVMVGDSFEKDIRPAARLGMHTVLVDGAAPSSRNDQPDRSIKSVADLTVRLVEAVFSDQPGWSRAVAEGSA